MISTDVVFIGAGAVGLFQIFELGLLGLRAHHRPHAANRRAVHQVVSRQTDLRYAGNPGRVVWNHVHKLPDAFHAVACRAAGKS